MGDTSDMVATARFAIGLLELLEKQGVWISLRGVRLEVDAPRGFMTAELIELLRANKVELAHELRLRAPCTLCGSGISVDTPIHGGRSLRRDCGVCGRTKGFPVWSERPVKWAPSRDDRGCN